MPIVGRGFLAGHLAELAATYPNVVIFAAGVSSTGCRAPDAFAAETELLQATMAQARADRHAVVYLSTASADIYGAATGPGCEGDSVVPTSAYGWHKLANEQRLITSGLDWLVVRLAHVVGAGQRPHQLVPSLAAQVRAGSVVVHRGAYRDIIAVADVAACMDALLAGRLRHEVVNLASGFSVSVEDVVAHLERRLGPAEHLVIDRPSGCRVSTEKLARLVPAVAQMGFGPNYFRHAVDAYLDAPVLECQR